MHSSRMRTGRLLPVSPSMHCSGGGGLCTCNGGVPAQWGVPARGVYLPGGVPCQWDVPAWGVYLPRGCNCQGCTCQGGTCLGGVPARGVYLPKGGIPAWGGVYLPRRVPAQVLPPREQNDRQVQKYYLAPNFFFQAVKMPTLPNLCNTLKSEMRNHSPR